MKTNQQVRLIPLRPQVFHYPRRKSTLNGLLVVWLKTGVEMPKNFSERKYSELIPGDLGKLHSLVSAHLRAQALVLGLRKSADNNK